MTTAYTLFMSIPTIRDLPGKSFEEVRIEDYLSAYCTTGRPPTVVPQEPADEQQRVLLNLPPLFKPYPIHDTPPDRPAPPLPVFSNLLVPGKTQMSPVPPVIANPDDLPAAQEFVATTSDGEISQSISVMPRFIGFSPEELRYYAYLKEHKLPPPSVQMSSLTQAPPPNLNPLTNKTVLQQPALNVLGSSTVSETLVSISTQTDFTDHSFEELRVACLQAGRELNSHEISLANAASGVPLLSRSSLFMGMGGGPFAHAPPVRPF